MTGVDVDDLWSAAQVAPTSETGQKLTGLVMQASDLEAEISLTETMLADLKLRRLKLMSQTIPEAMAEAGTSLWRTENGQLQVEVDTHVSGSLPKEDQQKRAACIRYVEELGGEGIIKADVVLSFGRANLDAARDVVEDFLDRDDCTVNLRQDIHPQTLMAWARERLKNGLPLEAEKANLWVGKMAKIRETKRG